MKSLKERLNTQSEHLIEKLNFSLIFAYDFEFYTFFEHFGPKQKVTFISIRFNEVLTSST